MPQKEQPYWEDKKIPMMELKYSFHHFIGDIQENSHAINYDVEIMYGNGVGEWNQSFGIQEKTSIGRARLKLIRWERAMRLGDAGYDNGFGGHEGIEGVIFKNDIWENELKSDWEEEMSVCPCKNILIIKDITLDAPYRGKGWGRLIIKQILHSFDGLCGIVLVSPFDLQIYECAERLIPYFESIGFSQTQYSDPAAWCFAPVMYLNMYKPNEKLNEIDVYTVCDY